ncbi:MAG TPA: hypothetical protein VK896_14215 [Gaiellaceae bacterium]|nr:hypothetical protein [Gaiellaceae bacterium]
MQAIGESGATWPFTEPRPEELDPDLLIVWMARHVGRQRLPLNRTVVRFDFRNPKRRYWMVLEPSEVSVCLRPFQCFCWDAAVWPVICPAGICGSRRARPAISGAG